MPSTLHHLSLKQKLILFSLLPLLMMGFFVLTRMYVLAKEYRAADHSHLAIQTTAQVTDLLYQLQNEYSLSVNGSQAATPSDETELQQQQTNTKKALTHLLTSTSFATLIDALTGAQPASEQLQAQRDAIALSSHNLASARQGVSDKQPQALTELYFQLNKQLLQLLQLLQLQTNDINQSRAYTDLLNLITVQELAVKERNVINQMLLSKELNITDYRTISTVIYEYGQAILHASNASISTKQSLIHQVQTSPESLQILKISQQIEQQLRISTLAKTINAHLGYGGLIDSFQDYRLTGTDAAQQKFNAALSIIRLNLAELNHEIRHLPELATPVNVVENTIEQYAFYMGKLHELKQQQRPLEDINGLLNIKKAQLNEAMGKLLMPPHPVTSQLWWKLTTDRINKLHAISKEMTQSMALQSEYLKTKALTLLGLYLFSAFLTATITLWLGRKIISNFMEKITRIANGMQQMAADPTLNININISGSDELARMARAMNRMISERQKASHALSRAAAVFNYSAEGIVVTDAENHIELINPAFTLITGYTLNEIKGHNPSILSAKRHQPHFYTAMWQSLQKEGKWEGEIWNKRKDGEVYPEYLAITVVKNEQGEIIQHIGLFMDISKRKQYEQDLWYQANFDSLTGLPNRKLFNERLQHEIQLAQHDSRKLAILLIDLDQFKYINDVQGHATGDLLLQDVAKRLESIGGQNDFIARIGGDEFVLILPRLTNELAIEHMATRIIETLATPFSLNEREIQISASFGIGVYPEDGLDVSSLTRNTEMAMYQAKDAGRNNFKYFTSGMNQAMFARMELEQRLRRAVAQNEFALHYQPIVDMKTGQVCSVEALIRWQDPDLGLIPPDHFIGIAEETGLIEPMGEWVLNQAMSDLRQWQKSGLNINVAINVSGRQCINTRGMSFDQVLQECFNRHHINPRNVHIEITESMLMGDASHCLSTLNAIRQLGSQIYIDDFGTGYSSLSYLKKYPISVIKIDRSFVEHALESTSNANLVKAIVMMGQSLEMKLVAEGIETPAQWNFLKDLGCDFAQGYLISKPLPFDDVTPLLKQKYQIRLDSDGEAECSNF
ncbi:EAL domain-containing protein [Shewanella putrefaciens]|uniref:bifunctional diguanylate cyclase/phosphodiesterase n=1 Tax=Shewanella putrefaciens TaxID=24 RepID=UPI0021C20933|nr:EAL domain-containing protein [Shewanella putrefaciens]UXK08479.1 EAL domain-containing protein [Shewanella putrefaciens]